MAPREPSQPRTPPPSQPPRPGERLDRYLVRSELAASRREAREMVASGRVRINGRRCKKGALLRSGDAVEVEREHKARFIEPEPDARLEILFEDAALLVINKPGGVPCYPLRPGERATVMNAVVARFPETASAGLNPLEGGLVHRLDNGTSGALVVARTPQALALFRDAMRSGRVKRRYLALVAGDLKGAIELTASIAHHPKSERRMLAADDHALARRLKARPAASHVEPLRRIGPFTLVAVFPQTGARHQIRVHLAAAGHPIVGDALYGGPPAAHLAPGRFWLHLAEIEFDSPDSRRVSVSAPLAPDLERAMEQLAGAHTRSGTTRK